jgi:transposase-like protein
VFINTFLLCYNINRQPTSRGWARKEIVMGRPKGGTNKTWSKEEKLKYVLMVIDESISPNDIQKKYGIYCSMIGAWVSKYTTGGINALENKRKPGNPLSKYSSKKQLTDLERLEYENMLLRIENERLKKGYTEKDAIIAKSSKRNMK